MAVYHFSAKVIQRARGRNAIAAAAYRAGAALYDEEAGLTFDYSDKPAVVYSEILLPAGAPARWLDRATLWNEVERIERRRDAVLARDIELALPKELNRAAAIRLARDFARDQFVARGMVADLNVHWGQAADGTPQPHAHIMLSMRRIVAAGQGRPGEDGGFGLKQRDWNDRALLRSWRAAWADLVNARLAEAGIDARVDHRSNAARGLDLEPQHKIGPAGARRGGRGKQAERAAEHRAIARRNGERLLAQPELALRALTEQQSTFTRQDLARLVNRHSDGATQFAAVMAKVEASAELVRVGQDGRGQARFSTREMVAIERRMEAAALDLSRRTTHPVALDRRRAMLAATTQGAPLGDEQLVAFGHVTRSRDLAVVVGYAGTGKSTMLGVARPAWEAAGYTVRGAALSGIAAEGLETGSGIASRTLASWEHAWGQGYELLGPRDVLVVDEAGMIGSRQMARVLDVVRRAGAKLVLVGDHEQLQAIEAGAAFRAIVERVGAAELTEVRRQHTGWQRDATRALATGRTAAALDRYAAAGMLHAHATDAAAEAAVVAGWQAARRRAPGERRIMLAHTRDSVRRMNDQARALRREAGELGPDQVLPTELGARAFAVGDRIYFLRNERGLGVRNGTLGTIAAIDGAGDDARLTVRLDRADRASGGAAIVSFALADYAHIDHGYAATTHKAQSVTVDRAHVLATPGMDRHLAYVALSRHRHGVVLHWSEESFGSRQGLAGRLGRERAKDTTLDYGDSEAELGAAYAERRGLSPHVPASGIAADRAGRPGPEPAALPAATGAFVAAQPGPVQPGLVQPGLARRNLLQAELDRALRPALAVLRAALDRQEAVTTALAATVERFASRTSNRPAAAARATPAPVLDVNAPGIRGSSGPSGSARGKSDLWTPLTAMLEASLAQEPLLLAVPYRPVTETEVAAAVAAHLESQPAEDRLTPLLAKAYRDPELARQRLDALLRDQGDEMAVEILRRGGMARLGKLRGRTGMFASQGARLERDAADRVASNIPEALLRPGRLHAELTQALRDQLEADRQRDTTAVPGLSDRALAAIERLRQAGADKWWASIDDLPSSRLSAGELARGTRVAAACSAIRGDKSLRDELTRFWEAADRRLHGRIDIRLDNPAGVKASDMLGVLDAAERLAARHATIEASRKAEQRKAERAEREAREKEAARVEMDNRFQEFQQRRFSGPRPGPRPSD